MWSWEIPGVCTLLLLLLLLFFLVLFTFQMKFIRLFEQTIPRWKCSICVVCVYNKKKHWKHIQWLQIVLMNRGFELMIGTVDKHAILLNLIIARSRRFSWRQTVFFFFLSLSPSLIIRFWKYPNSNRHSSSPPQIAQNVCDYYRIILG